MCVDQAKSRSRRCWPNRLRGRVAPCVAWPLAQLFLLMRRAGGWLAQAPLPPIDTSARVSVAAGGGELYEDPDVAHNDYDDAESAVAAVAAAADTAQPRLPSRRPESVLVEPDQSPLPVYDIGQQLPCVAPPVRPSIHLCRRSESRCAAGLRVGSMHGAAGIPTPGPTVRSFGGCGSWT